MQFRFLHDKRYSNHFPSLYLNQSSVKGLPTVGPPPFSPLPPVEKSGPVSCPVVRVLPLPLFCRGNNSEKHGNYPGTDQGFTTGIIEVINSSVLLASGRRIRAPAKPGGPGGGSRAGGISIQRGTSISGYGAARHQVQVRGFQKGAAHAATGTLHGPLRRDRPGPLLHGRP